MEVVSQQAFTNFITLIDAVRVVILIILILYAIFALIIVRQVDLMSKTLITPVSPIVKALAIIHAGFVIGFIFLAFGIM